MWQSVARTGETPSIRVAPQMNGPGMSTTRTEFPAVGQLTNGRKVCRVARNGSDASYEQEQESGFNYFHTRK